MPDTDNDMNIRAESLYTKGQEELQFNRPEAAEKLLR
jgi:hypothetical protein